jgi:hypothetical protein
MQSEKPFENREPFTERNRAKSLKTSIFNHTALRVSNIPRAHFIVPRKTVQNFFQERNILARLET